MPTGVAAAPHGYAAKRWDKPGADELIEKELAERGTDPHGHKDESGRADPKELTGVAAAPHGYAAKRHDKPEAEQTIQDELARRKEALEGEGEKRQE